MSENDLNQIITSAVLARVESEVLAALSGSGTLQEMVAAVLNQQIEVKQSSGYGTRKSTFMREMVGQQIKAAAEAAFRKALTEREDEIEGLVRSALDESLPAIAKQLVGTVADAAEKPYGVRVSLQYASS